MNYRREIDGLRAVAVVPVILFHAGLEVFSGGFAGVDIFFVISGYLITSILIAELTRGHFSIAAFYERRARRILPALFFVILCCAPLAWLWMTPPQLKEFSRSLVAVVFFSSNILFWREEGYFAAAAELKPLLHTWSLAVEEQYYLLFPILLLLMWRWGRSHAFRATVAIALASLLLSEWGWRNNSTANFYLAPTRAWELLAGSICAFIMVGHEQRTSNLLSAIGLMLIAFSIFYYDSTTPFPSLYALAPVVGAVLIILFGSAGTWVGKLLSGPILVGIGTVSYSAYLWHQPLFALTRIRSIGEPAEWLLMLLAAMSFALAYLSWRFVEQPFRKRPGPWLPTRYAVFAGSAVVGLAVAGFGAYAFVQDGFAEAWLRRQPPQVRYVYGAQERAHAENIALYFDRMAFDDGACRFNVQNLNPDLEDRILTCRERYGPGVAVLGDSHAIDLFGIVSQSSDVKFLIGVTKIACHLPTDDPACQYDEFGSFVERNRDAFHRIIFEKAGYRMLQRPGEESVGDFLDRLGVEETISGVTPDLDAISGVTEYLRYLSQFTPVLWVGPRIEPHIPTKYLLRHGCEFDYVLRPGQEEIFRGLDLLLRDAARDLPAVEYVSQNEIFDISFPRDFVTCDRIFWADGNHLSRDGEVEFAERFDLIDYITDVLEAKNRGVLEGEDTNTGGI